MLDLRQKRWDEQTLAQAGIDPGLLAPLVSAGTPLGHITSDAAALTGLPTTAVVAAGGHDHVCGALAAGVTRPGQMLNSLGTAEAVFLPIDQPLVDPRAGRQGYTQGAHVVGGGYYVFGVDIHVGRQHRLAARSARHHRRFRLRTRSDRRRGAVPAGSLGVLFLPHLRLANPPYDDPRSRGALIGLTMDTDRDVVTRAIFEGLALESRNLLEPLLTYPQVTPPQSVVAIGGGTRNPLLMRVKASVSNLILSGCQSGRGDGARGGVVGRTRRRRVRKCRRCGRRDALRST